MQRRRFACAFWVLEADHKSQLLLEPTPTKSKHHEPLHRADSSGEHWDKRFIHCRRFSTTILLLVQSRTSLKRCRLVNLPDQILDCGKNPLLNLIVWDRRHRTNWVTHFSEQSYGLVHRKWFQGAMFGGPRRILSINTLIHWLGHAGTIYSRSI